MAQSEETTNMQVSMIKAFTDNYIWAISSNATNKIALVDPGDADVCINFIKQQGVQLSSILITHHHADHVGGIEELVAYCQSNGWPITVYGPKNENIPDRNVALSDEDKITLDDLGFEFSIIGVPGHTSGHIAYLSQDNLFCGDTLFSAGCGRLFEGTPAQMLNSLEKLSALPERTRVYCAHEYTLANLNFALTVEPTNSELIHYYNKVIKLREQGTATIPTSILLEKKINPFLRCHTNSMLESVTDLSGEIVADKLTAFTIIRTLKDKF
ncbi:hydroxyacylglutathione hydrolase [Colwellia chukchiensis]|uniref:Hydroxyacylglutathione hydrolase n=1 Tax=Colwellia chukchiensis TaxID=641665 RepID=A0A1H7MAM1_9GAMM|nr:hydroxyacylglutathione hydrolase [Colwellia chukchiensis]SEL07775.1 hydroxyacylglutathione hydrolase [Colwellia chukchiensis]